MFLLLILTLVFADQTSTEFVSGVEKCRSIFKEKYADQGYFEEFPSGLGVGWDNLQNLPRSEIFNLTYVHCKLTTDMTYLVPDGVEVTNVKSSQLDKMANAYDTFNSYMYSESESINVDAGLSFDNFGISGSFSSHFQEVKHSMGESSATFRTKLEHHAYTALIVPGTLLNEKLRKRLLEVGEAFGRNHTNLAQYLCQLIIRDYGTHVTMVVDVGTLMVQEDFLDSKVLTDVTTNVFDIRSAAAASFFKVAKIDASVGREVNAATTTYYQSHLRHSFYNSFGGPNVKRILMNNSTKEMQITDLVVLDRSGLPIYDLVNEDYFPDLPLPTVVRIQNYLINATKEYYVRNTNKGCQTIGADNFFINANVDDGSCHAPHDNYTFGGLFQTCNIVSGEPGRCDGFTLNNGITGQKNCPTNYTSVQLFVTNHHFGPRLVQNVRGSDYDCGHWYHHKTCTEKKIVSEEVFYDIIQIEAYWCKAYGQVGDKSGYLFGGLFKPTKSNPFSTNHQCPGRFTPTTIGSDLSICLSRDFELDRDWSVKFSGFLTCGSAIPHCDKGYSQHLADIIDGCEIYYCVRPGAFVNHKKLPIHSPPFMAFPFEYEAFTVIQSTHDGRIWHRQLDGNRSWSMTRILLEDGRIPDQAKLLDDWASNAKSGLNGGQIAGTVIGSLVLVGIIVVAIFYIRKKVQRNSPTGYQHVDSPETENVA